MLVVFHFFVFHAARPPCAQVELCVCVLAHSAQCSPHSELIFSSATLLLLVRLAGRHYSAPYQFRAITDPIALALTCTRSPPPPPPPPPPFIELNYDLTLFIQTIYFNAKCLGFNAYVSFASAISVGEAVSGAFATIIVRLCILFQFARTALKRQEKPVKADELTRTISGWHRRPARNAKKSRNCSYTRRDVFAQT